MKHTSWLKCWWHGKQSGRPVSAQRRSAQSLNAAIPAEAESFEARQMLSVSALFIPGTGELSINSYGQDKVMFGTDYPVLGFKRTMDEVLELKLRPDPLRKFLRDNALRVYGLS